MFTAMALENKTSQQNVDNLYCNITGTDFYFKKPSKIGKLINICRDVNIMSVSAFIMSC